ncbi:MAG: DUF3604 domain-containing protein [Desulfobacteraceae bacterium]|nr:DUF3604 domain-containing protein [Desulfobacteraceae bacterium]
MTIKKLTMIVIFLLVINGLTIAKEPTQLYFGDTHLHTSYSFDAFLNRNLTADPDTAYRWAKGQPVIHPYHRARVQIGTPLDFLVVSDHAEGMGVLRAIVNEEEELGDLPMWGSIKRWLSLKIVRRAVEKGTGDEIFKDILPDKSQQVPGTDPVIDPDNKVPNDMLGDTTKTEITAWGEIIKAAQRHNDPGKFTTFIGWEWSSLPTGANLHRVVFTPNGAEESNKFLPYGSDQSQYPEDLWAWLDKTSRQTGAEFLAIPHNSNISKGYMFSETTLRGQPITIDYARTRMAWEPIVEITQIKGDSETHPSLSPDDEFAGYEPYDFYLQSNPEKYVPTPADFIRSALRSGLSMEEKIGVNPFKFGLIGSTDSHTGLSSSEENNFWGKMAYDSTPETKCLSVIADSNGTGWDMSAAGLAAVWATENTRQSIYSAFKRREVYATTGPRIKVRLFGGWSFNKKAVLSERFAEIGYAKGVPMGGDLTRPTKKNKKIQFMVRAVKDPKDANLDRIQIVKGWLDKKGVTHEKVFNIAWSDGRKLDANGKLALVGDTVDRSHPDYANTIGAPELSTLWVDSSFDPDQRAFYYVRVLQIPTPRHSLYDAIALQKKAIKKLPEIIQERAYTSPIWYTP